MPANRRGDPGKRSGELGVLLGGSGPVYHPAAAGIEVTTLSYLLGHHVIAPEAGGGTQIFGERIERLRLLVEEPHLERKRVSRIFYFCPTCLRQVGIYNRDF